MVAAGLRNKTAVAPSARNCSFGRFGGQSEKLHIAQYCATHDLTTSEMRTSNVLFGDCNSQSATLDGAIAPYMAIFKKNTKLMDLP